MVNKEDELSCLEVLPSYVHCMTESLHVLEERWAYQISSSTHLRLTMLECLGEVGE